MRHWSGESGVQTNKSASTSLSHWRYPSWQRLEVDGFVCLSIPRSAMLGFMDGVGEAVAPSGVSLLLLCPRCCGIVFDVMVERGGLVVQEYAQMVVYAGDSWKICILCWVCG